MKQPLSPLHGGRFYVLFTLLIVFWALLEANLLRLQVGMHDELTALAEGQYYSSIKQKAPRGLIYDRNLNKLAANILLYDIAVDPTRLENKGALVNRMATRFNSSAAHYRRLVNKPNTEHVYLERRVSQAVLGDLLQLDDPGFIAHEGFGRYYPLSGTAAQLLGFTNTEDKGLSGLELQYDSLLTGRDGEYILLRDGRRRLSFDAHRPVLPAIPGKDLVLTLDKNIQSVTEDALKKGVDAMRADNGMAVVLDPRTGAVLAMANYPGFDPNDQSAYGTQRKRNRVITDAFEPGSTMKMFTAAAILQERLHKPQDIVFCENGRYKYASHVYRDTKPHGWLSFNHVIEKSSNIGMIKLAEKMPSNIFFRYLKSFGFGEETGIGLWGEAEGSLSQPAQWSRLSRASISIGQEIGVTAIQISAAFAALVNGGYLYRPYVVKAVRDIDGSEEVINEPYKVRQIIAPEVSEILKGMMHDVVETGTGIKARPDGIEVGGKTGTAQKFDREKKQYTWGRYVSSFIGFAPYDEPRYICAVFIDEPRNMYYGGDVAGPVFRDIISQIIHISPQQQQQKDIENEYKIALASRSTSLPDMQGFSVEGARELLEERGYDVDIHGEGSIVKTLSFDDDDVTIETIFAGAERTVVPELRGLTLREALKQIDFARLDVQVQGNGTVVRQSLRAGTRINGRGSLVLYCN